MANAKEDTKDTKDEGPKEVRIKPDLTKYVNGVSGSGKKTKNCGDEVAQALDGFTLDEIRSVASKMTDVPVKEYTEKYAHLNDGMQIMNLRNRIRGAVAKLDKAHEADKTVVAGIPTLNLECGKGQAAVTKRRAEQAKAADERKAKAEASAKEKAKAESKGKGKGTAKAA